MSIATFIPQLWSARLIENLNNASVGINFINRDYEGEISAQGDRVHINALTDIAIKKYTKGTDIEAPDELTTSENILVIDQADYYNFKVNDIDKVQAKASLVDKAMQSASYGINDKSDKFIFSTLASAATAQNTEGTSAAAIALTAENVYVTIVKLRTKLDKNNVPTANRRIAIPPEMYALLLLDKRFTETGGAMAEGVVQSGMVGKVAGFDVYETNNLKNTSGKYEIIATVPMATTYADQIVSNEAYRTEKGFDDGVKGLHVYGAKNLQPSAVVKLFATFA